MRQPKKVIKEVVKTVSDLIEDGIITIGEHGLVLTPEGELWLEMRDRYRESNRRSTSNV